MTRWSIRITLTAWYVAVLAVATLALTGASWWLSTESVVRAADVGLQARVDGVQDFLENPRTRLTVEGLQDEFGEYAELTRGEALLEVIDASGTVLVRPSMPGWKEMADREAGTATSKEIHPVDRALSGSPYRVASSRLDAAGRVYRVTVAAPMGPAYAALNRFHRWLLLLLPAILALAGAGGYWISRRALTPVDEITRAQFKRSPCRVSISGCHCRRPMTNCGGSPRRSTTFSRGCKPQSATWSASQRMRRMS
jgi:hypothetical protein